MALSVEWMTSLLEAVRISCLSHLRWSVIAIKANGRKRGQGKVKNRVRIAYQRHPSSVSLKNRSSLTGQPSKLEKERYSIITRARGARSRQMKQIQVRTGGVRDKLLTSLKEKCPWGLLKVYWLAEETCSLRWFYKDIAKESLNRDQLWLAITAQTHFLECPLLRRSKTSREITQQLRDASKMELRS